VATGLATCYIMVLFKPRDPRGPNSIDNGASSDSSEELEQDVIEGFVPGEIVGSKNGKGEADRRVQMGSWKWFILSSSFLLPPSLELAFPSSLFIFSFSLLLPRSFFLVRTRKLPRRIDGDGDCKTPHHCYLPQPDLGSLYGNLSLIVEFTCKYSRGYHSCT
jgi:hypothetical protein